MGAFLDVLLRGSALVAQSALIGAAIFVLFVLRPWDAVGDVLGGVLGRVRAGAVPNDSVAFAVRRVRRVVIVAALALAGAQAAALALAFATLAEGGARPVGALFSTTFFLTGTTRLILALGSAGIALGLARRERERSTWYVLAVLAIGGIVTAAGMSHAAARLDNRAALVALDALHQLAGGIWIGGLMCLVALAAWLADRRAPDEILPRFSTLALTAVSVLAVAGMSLSFAYIDAPGALVGTAYGVMVLTKVIVLVALLVLGAANFRAVRRRSAAGRAATTHLRRYVEVELGLGITVLLAAASLTSLPPASDVVTDRATVAEVASRFTPRLPTFTSPRHEELPAGDREAPRTDEDRAWSEYNHHVSGLFVLAMGLLASIAGIRRQSWPRHWPLLFLGLGVFLFARSDPGAWPLGPVGFWESRWDPAVLQHRFFVVLVVAFAFFEWGVRTGRLTAPRWSYVFPILCAVGGAVLLTHSHAMLNLKSELLIEVTHTPLALLGTVVGWGRWLEIRLPASDARFPGRLSGVALALVGVVLLIYRER